jgi:peptidoglycan hydrolase-like protein with peptidoglycan-binding domain
MSTNAERRRGRRTVRWAGMAVAVAVLVVAVVGVWQAVVNRPRAASSSGQIATATAAVSRGTVTERLQIAGTLGFDGSYSVAHQGNPGITTWVAEAGSTVDRGGSLYAVANEPVRLLIGTLPAYRDFGTGMPDGPDVKQLEENLAALGMRPGKVDAKFTADTVAAVKRWQAAWGLPAAQRTGVLPLGTVVFAPVPLRVGQATAAVGAPLGPGAPVFSATSTGKVITAQLTTDRQRSVHAGDPVQVSLSSSAPVPGTVVKIGRVAVASSQNQNQNGPNQNTGEMQSSSVTITIQATLPPTAADLDQAPVQVAITTRAKQNVLLVPVTALLAKPGGGYQVRLESGGYQTVTPGLFDSTNGTVEVSGQLTVGQLVQVPA